MIPTIQTAEPVTFAFYLEAWLFCRRNGVPLDRIKKVSFRLWSVDKED